MRILCFADYYLPGFKAGGPIRALSNLVDAFAGEIQFDIVTREYDLGGDRYPDVTRGRWYEVGAARVRYVGAQGLPRSELRAMLVDPVYDAVYLNSVFSPLSRAVVRERFTASRAAAPLIIAPRGEFSAAALKLKPVRKTVYLAVLKRMGALDGVLWQASSAHEANDILAVVGNRDASVFVTEEIPGRSTARTDRPPKRAGMAAVTFLSRICRMKNLDAAIDVMRGVKGNVDFAVYGPIEDREYWEDSLRGASLLPQNVKFDYKGVVPQDAVGAVLSQSDLFFLPTRGENYGHVIIEALAAGCPVLVSDRTRWRDLEAAGIGWDISLDNLDAFRSALHRVVEMGEDQHSGMRARALEYARSVQTDPAVIEQNRRMFESAAGSRIAGRMSLTADAAYARELAGAAQSRDVQ